MIVASLWQFDSYLEHFSLLLIFENDMDESAVFFLSDFHRCNKALSSKGQDASPCEWYQRVYQSLCPMSWVNIPGVIF
uniref:Uncharacterized protein n=1 Tax=Cyprinus carpio TaxID=7962 RepID=A0A8C1ZQ84_CYPCA